MVGSGGLALASVASGHDHHGPPSRHGPARHGDRPDGGPAGTGSVLYVAANGSDAGSGGSGSNNCQAQSAPCATVAHAVSVAASGATIMVGPGSYTVPGTVDLSQPVTIEGQGAAVLTGAAPIFSIGATAAGTTSAPGTVTIRGLRFENVTGTGDSGVITAGAAGAGNVMVEGNTFSGISEPAIGYQGAAGLAAPLGTNWQVLGNLVEGATDGQAGAIALQDLTGSLVAGNVVRGAAGSGIVLAGTQPGANVNDQVVDNAVAGVAGNGIEVGGGNGVLVKGNRVEAAGTTCTGSEPAGPPMSPMSKHMAKLSCTPVPSSSAAAVMLTTADQTNVTVVDNTAADSPVGVAVGPPPGTLTGTATTLGTGIAVIENDLTGDTLAGVAYGGASSGPALNAMLDWWGCPTGPATSSGSGGTTPAAGCSPVLGNVDATPFATSPIELPSDLGLPPGLARRDGGVALPGLAAKAGADVSLHAEGHGAGRSRHGKGRG